MKISVKEAYSLMLTEYPDVLTVHQTAKILGCEAHQVYRMIQIGSFPCVRIGKSYRISKYGLIQYLLNTGIIADGLQPTIAPEEFERSMEDNE